MSPHAALQTPPQENRTTGRGYPGTKKGAGRTNGNAQCDDYAPHRPRHELRVVLHTEEERVVIELEDLHALALGVMPCEVEPPRREMLDLLGVNLVPAS